jgi:hypothetical protein
MLRRGTRHTRVQPGGFCTNSAPIAVSSAACHGLAANAAEIHRRHGSRDCEQHRQASQHQVNGTDRHPFDLESFVATYILNYTARAAWRRVEIRPTLEKVLSRVSQVEVVATQAARVTKNRTRGLVRLITCGLDCGLEVKCEEGRPLGEQGVAWARRHAALSGSSLPQWPVRSRRLHASPLTKD